MAAPFTPDDPIRVALEQTIGFQYEIVRLLGRGGMGAVYHAHERALDRPVAIKVLPPEVSGFGEARDRFLREARTAARLTHPNIVPLFTFGETNGLVYYVMGYVDGESLDERIRRQGKLDPDEAAQILTQLAQALEYAHRQGVVHRDVKPDNVLLERGTGVAKLTDFGIAKRAAAGETLTGTGLLVGTPRYMSPEQASGDRELDARSDIYSLGLVGYAMVTGRPPFDGASVQEILTQQVTRDAPPVEKVAEVPSSLAGAINRALAKSPQRRWPSAGEMAATLAEDSVPEGNIAKTMKRPGVYAVSVVSIVLAGLNGGWVAFWWPRVPRALGLVALLYTPALFVAEYAWMRWGERRPRQEMRALYTQPPRWWPWWWPRTFRRRDDVWPRLPAAVRRMRGWLSAGFASVVIGVEATFLVLMSRAPVNSPFVEFVVAPAMVVAYGLPLVAWAVAYVTMLRFGKRHGLSRWDARRMLQEPTGRPGFWAMPRIAALLSAKPETVVEPERPEDVASSIEDKMRELPPLVRERVQPAVRAARELARVIDQLETEVGRLARDADPVEAERLRERLRALDGERGRQADSTREMRRLYASQLDLLGRLSAQREVQAARRDRYVELLRTLWLQVSTLRAQHSSDELPAEVTDRIRLICADVEREVAGTAEANALASSIGAGSGTV